MEKHEAAVQHDPGNVSHCLPGLACFQRQKYAEAAAHYAKSLEKDLDDKDVQEMHNASGPNALA